MSKKICLFVFLLCLGSVFAEYIFCKDSDEAKKVMEDKKDGVLMVTFITENDTVMKVDLEVPYKEIAEEFSEKVNIAIVNFTQDEELSSKYGLTRLPTTIILKNGVPVNGFKGKYPVDAIKNILKISCR